MLLSDRILILLNGAGPRSNKQIAEFYNSTRGAISTANSFNRSMSFIEPVGLAMNRAAGDVQFKITESGIQRVNERLLAPPEEPVKGPTELQQKVLKLLRKGPLTDDDWTNLGYKRKTLWSLIYHLRLNGYVIEAQRIYRRQTYILKSEPK